MSPNDKLSYYGEANALTPYVFALVAFCSMTFSHSNPLFIIDVRSTAADPDQIRRFQ